MFRIRKSSRWNKGSKLLWNTEELFEIWSQISDDFVSFSPCTTLLSIDYADVICLEFHAEDSPRARDGSASHVPQTRPARAWAQEVTQQKSFELSAENSGAAWSSSCLLSMIHAMMHAGNQSLRLYLAIFLESNMIYNIMWLAALPESLCGIMMMMMMMKVLMLLWPSLG